MRVEDIRRMAHDIIDRCAVENDHIEYKKSSEHKDGILKTACAYANNYMNREIGLLFIGIEEMDDKETGQKAVPVRPISGIDEDKIETIENGMKSLLSYIHPRPVYHLIQDEIDDRFYIILAVEPGHDGPFETDQRAEKDKKINLKAGRYIRIRRDTRLPNHTEEFELLRKFAEFNFSSELNSTATLDNLNFEYMKEYLARTNAAEDVRTLSKLEMARTLHLIDTSEYGGNRARNFAVLMFAERPADYIPYAYVRIIREVKGTDKMESRIFDGPVWIQAQQVRDYFRDNIVSTYTIREPGVSGAHKVSNWPLETFEELATNCILHKDYSRKQMIEIAVYSDHMSFINHNRPLPPVTIEDLNEQTVFADRQYVNDELKEMFFKLDLIQSYGSGIRRAKKAMEINGSPKIVFSPENDTDDYTLAVVPINEEFARIQLEEQNVRDNVVENVAENVVEVFSEATNNLLNGYSKKRKEAATTLLRAIAANHSITIAEMAVLLNMTARTVQRYLKEFQDAGVLRREGSDASGEWILQ